MERTVIDTIKKLRKEHGLTQEELAKKLFCKRQKITDFERYKSFPSTDEIIALSKIFGVTTDYLLGQSIAKTRDTTLQAVCDYTKLSEESIDNLKVCHRLFSDQPTYWQIANRFIASDAFYDIVYIIGEYLCAKEEYDNAHKELEKISKREDFSNGRLLPEDVSEKYSILLDQLESTYSKCGYSLFECQEKIKDFAKDCYKNGLRFENDNMAKLKKFVKVFEINPDDIFDIEEALNEPIDDYDEFFPDNDDEEILPEDDNE